MSINYSDFCEIMLGSKPDDPEHMLSITAGGSILMEVVFTLPGMGRMWLTSIYQRDYPMIMGIGVLISAIFVFVNLLTDLAYGWLDPRIRYE